MLVTSFGFGIVLVMHCPWIDCLFFFFFKCNSCNYFSKFIFLLYEEKFSYNYFWWFFFSCLGPIWVWGDTTRSLNTSSISSLRWSILDLSTTSLVVKFLLLLMDIRVVQPTCPDRTRNHPIWLLQWLDFVPNVKNPTLTGWFWIYSSKIPETLPARYINFSSISNQIQQDLIQILRDPTRSHRYLMKSRLDLY